MRRSILACGLLLAFAGMATAAAAATASNNSENSPVSPTSATTTTVATTETRKVPSRWALRMAAASRRHIRRYRADTRHWLAVIHGRPPATGSTRLLAAR